MHRRLEYNWQEVLIAHKCRWDFATKPPPPVCLFHGVTEMSLFHKTWLWWKYLALWHLLNRPLFGAWWPRKEGPLYGLEKMTHKKQQIEDFAQCLGLNTERSLDSKISFNTMPNILERLFTEHLCRPSGSHWNTSFKMCSYWLFLLVLCSKDCNESFQ